MERVLVTGGAGYVGSTCVAQLLSRGYEVDVVDDLSTGHRDAVPEGAAFHLADIGDEAAMSALLSGESFDIVFHFAAKALIPESMTNPALFFDVNVKRGMVLLEALRKVGVRKFIFSSTAAVYGNPHQIPIPEDHPKNPVNSYGESKLMFEHMLCWYASAYDWSVVAFRYFNACGGTHAWGERHEPETHIIPLLLQAASGRRPGFKIYGTDWPTADGTCLRDYVHVVDIAEAHILAMKKMTSAGFHVYNIGVGKNHSVREVWHTAQDVTGEPIPMEEVERRPGDPAILCADPTRLKTELGWEPQHSELNSIISGAWAWEKAQSVRAEVA